MKEKLSLHCTRTDPYVINCYYASWVGDEKWVSVGHFEFAILSVYKLAPSPSIINLLIGMKIEGPRSD